MEIERSNVPGYDATLVQLTADERFILRNPMDLEDVIAVRTVVAFDHGSATDPRPYFRAWGTTFPDGRTTRELDYNFTDTGYLPPHVRDAIEREGVDHAPEETLGPALARNHRRTEQPAYVRPPGRPYVAPLDPETVARLRTEHNVTPRVDTSRNWAATLEGVDRTGGVAPVTDISRARAARDSGKAFAVLGEHTADGVRRPDGSTVSGTQAEQIAQGVERQLAMDRHPSQVPSRRPS